MKRFIRAMLIALVVVVCGGAVLLFAGLSIPLDFLDTRLETVASRLLQRPVTVRGPVRVSPSLTPSLDLGGVVIGNPAGWPEDMAPLLAVERSSAGVSLVDLLRGEVRITELEFSGADIALITRADGTTNFSFPRRPGRKEAADGTGAKHELSGLDRLSITDLRLRYVDGASGNDYEFSIDEAHGHAGPDENLGLTLAGELLGRPCSLRLDGGRLGGLLRGDDGWPIDGRLSVGDASFDVDGSFTWSRPDRVAYLAASLSGASLAGLGEVAGAGLPAFTDYSVAADISLLPARVLLTGLTVEAAELAAPARGDLVVNLHGARPHIGGTVTVEELDLSRLAAAFSAPTADEPAAETTAGNGGPEQNEAATGGGQTGDPGGERTAGGGFDLPWHLLTVVDSDLHLRAGAIRAGESRFTTGLETVVSLVDGDLVVPLTAVAMGIPLDILLDVASSGEAPAVALRLSSPGGGLDPLFSTLVPAEDLQGGLGDISLAMRAGGFTPADLATSLALDLSLEKAAFARAGTRLITAESLALAYDPQRLFSLTAAGTLLGRPLTVDTAIGADPEAEGEPGALAAIDITACDSTLQFSAARPVDDETVTSFSLAVEGRRLCGLMTAVERFSGHDAPFAVTGTGALTEDAVNIDFSRLELGLLDLDGSLELIAGDDDKPVITVALSGDRIDLPALLRAGGRGRETDPETASKEPDGAGAADPAAGLGQLLAAARNVLAWEMIPLDEYLTTDGRLDLAVAELDTGEIELTDVRVSAIVAAGALKPSPFQARVGGNLFTGTGAVDTTGETPVVAIDLATDEFSLEAFDEMLGLEYYPDLTVGHVGISMDFTGTTIAEMLLQADYRFEVRDGRWVLERDGIDDLVVTLARFDYRVRPGAAATIALSGDVNALPLSVDMTGDGLFEREGGKPVVISVKAGLADTALIVDGRLARSGEGWDSMALRTELSGARMNSLDELFGVHLPPFGPYRIGGTLVTTDGGIGVHEMVVEVGDSSLTGRFDVDEVPGGKAPDGFLVDVQGALTAETIQLRDFDLQGWSPLTGGQAAEDDGAAVVEETDDGAAEAGAAGGGSGLRSLLSPELAEMLQGNFSIEVKEVLSGRDRLGSGLLRFAVEQGDYVLDTLRLDVPGGAVSIDGEYRPGADRVSAALRMAVERFDYGIMARRVKPDTSIAGEMNIDLDLRSAADTPLELKNHLDGRLRVGVVPEGFEAGVIDLWASNIILEVLPALLKGEPSVVNCVAGDFTLTDGLMQPELFLLDTTKVRVQGTGTVDLQADSIDFHLRPTPKSAHFFSLATPITVSGSIYRPDISVTSADVLKTVFRQLTSVVTVPFQWLFTDSLEPDGAAACGAAMEWVLEKGVPGNGSE